MRFFVALAFASAVSATKMEASEYKFMQYIVQHSKEYNTLEEYNMRKENFLRIEAEIIRLNQSQSTSIHAHNYLSDWTREEYQKLLGLKNMPKPDRTNKRLFSASENALPTLPTSVNWVTVSPAVVNPIKDQGSCGSCWAFSANASLESAHAIFYSTLYSLSEQQLVSCSGAYGNGGCQGGWYYYAWDYATVTPITTETVYPYTSGQHGVTGRCTYTAGSGVLYDQSQTDVATDTTSIMTAIAQQVVSVAIEADTSTFQTYSSGVITSAACGTNIDHAVAAVGYGTDPTAGGYYLVRNSWGTSWGDQGYVKIGQAGGAGICGINQYVAFPTVKA
jgi:C1A family cysteine protease